MKLAMSLSILLLSVSCVSVPNRPDRSVSEQLEPFYDVDPSLKRFISHSYAYAIYPSVGKGGFGLGGAYGKGWVYERGVFVGTSELVQVTYGFQIGGKTYAEIVAFENKRAFDDFKDGHLELSAQISAVALRTGASANAPYRNGVAIFTAAERGLMGEISIGGQKFSFKPAS